MKLFSKNLLYILFFAIVFNSCTKEISLETGAASGIATGVLTDSLGECKKAILEKQGSSFCS